MLLKQKKKNLKFGQAHDFVCFYVLKILLKKFKIFLFLFFYFKLIYFFMFSDYFDVLISKMIFKK